MTGKDVIKMILCMYGYDRNIEIKTYTPIGGGAGYDIYAEDKNGEPYTDVSPDGLLFTIHNILEFMQEEHVHEKTEWWTAPLKYVLDDNLREELIKRWDEEENKRKENLKRLKPFFDYIDSVLPCNTCEENPKDLDWYPHYKCSRHYHHSCSKLREWEKLYDEKIKEYQVKED